MQEKDEREKLKADLVAKGVSLHDKARLGDVHATREACEVFRLAHQLDPDDATVLAYYGSALSMTGRDAVDPNLKVQNALRGLKLLDQAVQADPDNITVRVLRAYVNYRVPEHFFNRTSVAVEDFTYLAKRYEEDPKILSRSSYWEILFHLGKAYQTLEEPEKAREIWQKLIAVKPSLRYLRLLRAEGFDVGPIDEDAEAAAARARLLQEGVALHDRGIAGDKAAAEQALQLFEAAVEEYPDDALIKAYYGSSISLASRYAGDANDMFAGAIKGMKQIDEAVKIAPDSVEVRFVRARHGLRLPELFFRRTSVAIIDLEYLRDRHNEGSLQLPRQEWLELLWMLGSAYLRLDLVDEAKTAWDALLQQDPDGPYKALIEAELAPVSSDIEVVQVDPADKEALLREGIRLHDLGVRGNKSVVPKAYELLEKAYQLDPDDPVARAYWGSVIALSVKDSGDTSAMFSKVIQGMIHLNTAVKLAPDNAAVRRLRGYLCFKLPETMFHLTKTAIEDFEFLRKEFEAKGADPSDPAFGRLLQDLATAYQRVGRHSEAQAIMQQLEGSEHGVH